MRLDGKWTSQAVREVWPWAERADDGAQTRFDRVTERLSGRLNDHRSTDCAGRVWARQSNARDGGALQSR